MRPIERFTRTWPELESLLDSHRQMITTARARLLTQALNIPLDHFPLVDEQTSEYLLGTFDDAKYGFRLNHRPRGRVTKKFMDITNIDIKPRDVMEYIHSFTLAQGEDTHRYSEAYVLALVHLMYLAKKQSISFFDLPPADTMNLGDQEYTRSFWYYPTDQEGVWMRIGTLKRMSAHILNDPEPVPVENLLTVAHYFATGLQLLQYISEIHPSE